MTLISEILALAAVFAVGYYMLLENDPAIWWREQLSNWLLYSQVKFASIPNLVVIVSIGAPALVVSIVDLVIDFTPFHFLLSGGMLLVGLRVKAYMRYQPAIIKAVYANDDQLATQLANEWEGRSDGLEDGREQFVSRMLSFCATRLHEDVLAVLVWYVLLGPAGVVLVTANRLYFQQEWAQPVSINPIDWVSEMFSKLLFAVSGSMTRGIQSLAMRPARAALMAGDIEPDNISLDLVTSYGKMLMRAMFTGLIVAGVLLLSFS